MIRVGETVTLYDGTEAVVEQVRCNLCLTGVIHDECDRWLRVGERRWVTEEALA